MNVATVYSGEAFMVLFETMKSNEVSPERCIICLLYDYMFSSDVINYYEVDV